MRKKTIKITIIVVLLHIFGFNFLYVEASGQPAVCNSPSETMADYFGFQNKARSILLGSELNEKRYSASFGSGWLFSNKILELHNDTAIDVLAWSVGNLESMASNAITSAVLVLLISASIIQSGTDGIIILFKDRPIVRDYKEMLDIESSIFDVAFFLSKQVNLTRPLESDLSSKFADLIKEYQKKGLLEPGLSLNKNDTSIADILPDLLNMNARMKHFIFWGGEYGKSALRGFNGCLGNSDSQNCQKSTAVIKFSEKAIEQLDEDYREARSFSSCNSYANFFESSIKKTRTNNLDSVKDSVQDMKSAMERLKGAMIGKGRWNLKNRKGICEGISDYEMAQLKAYWGPDWTCGSWVNVSVDVPSAFLEIKEYFNNKKDQREQKQKMKTASEGANQAGGENGIDVVKELNQKISTKDREVVWLQVFGSDSTYNPNFSMELYSEFDTILNDTINQYGQAQENAISADVSYLFLMGNGILDQVDSSILKVNDLEKILGKIKDKQCF